MKWLLFGWILLGSPDHHIGYVNIDLPDQPSYGACMAAAEKWAAPLVADMRSYSMEISCGPVRDWSR